MPILGRISSNKDHGALYHGTAAVRKPRLAGIGKAPTRARILSGKHDDKAAKVLRALRKASIRNPSRLPPSLVSGNAALKPAPQPSAQAPTPAAQPAEPLLPGAVAPVRSLTIRNSQGSVVRVPAHLPKPAIAPNLHMTMTDGTVVPTLFVQDRLGPLLQRIHTYGSYFQPYPHVPSPPTPDPAMVSGLRESFAWGVPYIINGHDTDATLASALLPFQPDVCLALHKRGAKGEPFNLFAINYTVYAAFFSYFPRRFNLPPSARVAKAITGDANDRSGSSMAVCGQCKILPHEDDMENFDDLDDSASSVSSASAVASLEVGEHIHLPVLAIDLPDPATFELVHERLHTPCVKWQPALLGLNFHHAITPQAAQSYLAQRSLTELVKTLGRIQGVWRNISALGLENDAMWRELGSAYCIIVDVILARIPKSSSAA